MKRIVILGGGFGGVAAMQRFDRRLRHDAAVEIELVSDVNFLIYTPLLAEVVGGTIEARHTMPPVRAFLRKAHLREMAVQGIDIAGQTVHGGLINGDHAELHYDYLVIALGAVTNFSHAAGAGDHAVGLKDIVDAGRLRNRALTLLEWANTTRDLALRRELLTFVVAGGGFSAVEGIAALEDLLHAALRYYPGIRPEEVRLILAPHGKRLLEEVDERLGAYVIDKFHQRTIEVRHGVGVRAVTERSATLTTGEVIPTRTVIWTAGIAVNPVLRDVYLPKDHHGALLVDVHLQVRDHPTVFALGDCAAVPTPDGRGYYAPTAQNAIRQGPVAADNIVAAIRKTGRTKTFAYKPIGSLASLGQRQAVAQIGNLRMSGFPAWLAWRGIYLAKLPTLADKVRVGVDWITDMFAPIDTQQIPFMRENIAAAERLEAGVSSSDASSNSPEHVSPSAPIPS